MAYLGRWGRPWATFAIVAIVEGCGGSESQSEQKPEAGIPDAAVDAPSRPSTGGAGGGGAGGTAGVAGAAGMPPGAGCTLGDAAVEPGSGGSGTAPPDAGTVHDASMPGTPDGSSAGHDAAIVDGGMRGRDAAADAGGRVVGPVTYPRLKIADIGKAVAVGSDFLFTEGPIWDPAQQALFFTDINADVIYRLTLPDTLEVAVKNMGHADGLALDPEGNLIGAGYVSRDIWRLDGSKIRPITDSYRARKYNSPDELAARSDGVIYFTDPTFGINGSQGFTAQTAELCFQGVYRIMPSGAVYLEDQTTAGPNGVILSPDEQIVYVSYTNTGEVHAFDVAEDGSLHNKRLFASGVSVADSSCVDAAGNLYVAAINGIVVLDSKGAQVGVIPTPGQVPTNCAFGGPDQRTFFITARIGLVGVPMAGNSALFKIENMPIPGIPGRP